MVTLEELAAQFNLRVQEAIKRLEDLQEIGRITGMNIRFSIHFEAAVCHAEIHFL